MNRFAKCCALLTALVVGSGSLRAQSDRWWLSGTAKGGEFTIYIDTVGLILENGSVWKTWVKYQYPSPQAVGKQDTRTYTYLIEHVQVDCKKRLIAWDKSVMYAADGTSVQEFAGEDHSFVDPIPDSVGEGVVEKICDVLVPARRK